MSETQNKTQANKENKMGTMPIPKLVITMAFPIIVSMIVQALYNIVDSMFVAQINEEAFNAVSLAMPVQTLMVAVASGTSVGINAMLSRNLGKKNFEEASTAANNGLFLALVHYIIFAVLGLFGTHLYYTMQTTDVQIVGYGSQYLHIVTLFAAGTLFQVTTDRILQSLGKSFYTMISQSTGAIINIILDPILIFGLFGLPECGVAGAAIATIFSQASAIGLNTYFLLRKNTEIKIGLGGFRPNLRMIKKFIK